MEWPLIVDKLVGLKKKLFWSIEVYGILLILMVKLMNLNSVNHVGMAKYEKSHFFFLTASSQFSFVVISSSL